jgi:hypothetical protein
MVGDYFDGVTVHGFVDTGGQFVTVDGPGAIDYTHLNGINDSGDISGMYGTGSLQGSFIATPTGNSAATASVRLSDLLSSQTANISMADLLPAVGGSGSPSAQSASLGGPVDQGVALGGRLAVPGLTDTPMSMWPTNSG